MIRQTENREIVAKGAGLVGRAEGEEVVLLTGLALASDKNFLLDCVDGCT